MNAGLAIQVIGLIIILGGLFVSYSQSKPSLFSYLANITGIYKDLIGDNYFEKAKVEIRALEINTPNPSPEIGHDSEYELNIVTKNPIALFQLTVRIPDSTWEPNEMFSLFSDTITGDRVWYPIKINNGYAIFEIKNAAGKYHLTFGNKQPEQLTIKDLSW